MVLTKFFAGKKLMIIYITSKTNPQTTSNYMTECFWGLSLGGVRLLRFNLKLSKPGETLKTQDINKVQWNMLFVVVRDFWDSWNTSYFGIQVFWKQFVVTEYFN